MAEQTRQRAQTLLEMVEAYRQTPEGKAFQAIVDQALQRHIDAAERSQRITAEDLAITINVRA